MLGDTTMRGSMLRLLLSLALTGAVSSWAAEPTVPELADIPGGEFQMGSAEGHSWEQPVHPVRVPPFKITVRPITNGQYRLFRPGHQSKVASDDRPVTGVSWNEAQEYAAWLSAKTGRKFVLPTEARWERAARGGLVQQDYPWGDQPGSSQNSTANNAEPAENAYGVRAVGYNLWEWTTDWYAADYFARSPADDPAGPPEGSFRVLRGGGYRDDPASASTYTRGSARPDTRSEHITFRLMEAGAATPPVQVSEVRPPAVEPDPPAPAHEPTPAPEPAPAPATTSAAASAQPAPPAAKVAPAPKPAPKPAPAQPKPAPKPAASVSAASATVNEIDVRGEGDEVVVQVRGNGTLGVKSFVLSGPDRIVVDVTGAQMKTPRKFGEIPVELGAVSKVRYALFQPDPPIIRIVIDAKRSLKHLIETRTDGFVVRLGP